MSHFKLPISLTTHRHTHTAVLDLFTKPKTLMDVTMPSRRHISYLQLKHCISTIDTGTQRLAAHCAHYIIDTITHTPPPQSC